MNVHASIVNPQNSGIVPPASAEKWVVPAFEL